jgi:hypothetical protein
MTSSDGAELQRARLWSASLAERVNGVVADIEGIARRVAVSWPDARGDACGDRLHALSCSLERDADAAAELGRTIDRLVDAQSTPSFGSSRRERLGPRLGDIEARRADDERGVDIPWHGADPRSD